MRKLSWLWLMMLMAVPAAQATTWQLLRSGMNLCEPSEQGRYRHRLIVFPVQVAGAIPLAWRSLHGAFDDTFLRVMQRDTDFDIRYMQGLELLSLSADERRRALTVLGKQFAAQYLLLPRIDRPRESVSTTRDPVVRLAKWAGARASAKTAVELGVTLELYDLRRGTRVAAEEVAISAQLPRRVGKHAVQFDPAQLAPVSDFAKVVNGQLACEPVSLPIVSARGTEVELGAGSDLGLEPGDVLDLALVQAHRFGTSTAYRTNPINEKITLIEVLPERSLATLSARAEVINLQPGDIALGR
ncbi:MAG: hypothetical protein ACPGUF_03655 [Litorivicinus sp.]